MEDWLVRSELLLGKEVLESLRVKRVAVVGLGGVGAYAAEMLARAGIENMVIVDSDVVSQSNKNRQLLALNSTIGKAKCDVMASRLMDINPDIHLEIINEFLTEDNVSSILSNSPIDYIVDAIDTLSPKISLIQYALNNNIPIVSSMGAGAKLDATKIRVKDISKSFNCPLAYMLRKRLRKVGISKGFKVVFSEELPDERAIMAVEEQNKKSIVGTISYLPAVFGSVCAQVVIQHYVNPQA
jgi:tRNA A37 threonylcarbamoyladenosine dehydratase